jgi:hypothetical protein
VLRVEVIVVHQVDEELGAPRVRAGVRHRDRPAVVPVLPAGRELVLDRF